MTTLDGTGRDDDAQRRLQQQSLRNVRALVEKMEREETGRIGLGRFVLLFLVIVAMLLGGIVGIVYLKAKPGEARTRVIEIDPQR